MARRVARIVLISTLMNAIFAQTSVCIWGRDEWNQRINGLYTVAGTHNNKPYYLMNNGCWEFYIYWYPTTNSWRLHDSLGTTLRHAYCVSPTLSNCNAWYVYNVDTFELDTSTRLIVDACPSLECDQVEVKKLGSGCDLRFDVHLGDNLWTDSETSPSRYWYFYPNNFRWKCSEWDPITSHDPCGADALAKSFQDWDNNYISSGESVNMQMDPSGHATVKCIVDPTPAPTTYPTASPTKNPSTIPTSSPTNVPTSNPSTSPTWNPSIPPTSNPSNPSNHPTNTPSNVPTSNPSHSPTLNPSISPTLGPSNPPTFITLNPSDISTSLPSNVPSSNPSNSPTTATRNPSNLPTLSPIPTSNPSHTPTEILIQITSTTSSDGRKKDVKPAGSMFIHISLSVIGVCVLAIIVICIVWQRMRKKEAMANIEKVEPKQTISMVSTEETQPNVAMVETPRNKPEILSWLESKVGLPEHYQTFVNNGYESMDFVRQIADVSELQKMGIRSVEDQRCIMVEIQLLQSNERTKNHEEQKVQQWLKDTVKLPEYEEAFLSNGYDSMMIVCDISKREELEEIGITSKGHQVRIMSKIKLLQNQQNAVVVLAVQKERDGNDEEDESETGPQLEGARNIMVAYGQTKGMEEAEDVYVGDGEFIVDASSGEESVERDSGHHQLTKRYIE
eukprot:500000_1